MQEIKMGWTHYRLALRVPEEKARDFYIDECVKSKWSTRQLERQINTHFYERLLSSRDKEAVSAEIQKTATPPDPKDFIRDPVVLDFLDIKPTPNLYEKDLETAIINHLQEFLLEMGRGFSFIARQKRISFDGRDFYIDLVFYHYILKCFVLIDLKIGDLTHQDLGQMQMYVNYYTREMMNEGDNPPIGIILCADKSEAIVRYTLPEDNRQIFTSKYKLYLPTEEELRTEIERQKEVFMLQQAMHISDNE
jgi:predicted nuclease of restriction endonuclease-like (RecB) superfamily